jgi:hypothetical protein
MDMPGSEDLKDLKTEADYRHLRSFGHNAPLVHKEPSLIETKYCAARSSERI